MEGNRSYNTGAMSKEDNRDWSRKWLSGALRSFFADVRVRSSYDALGRDWRVAKP